MSAPRYKCVGCGRFGHEQAGCTTTPVPRKGQDNGGIRTLQDIRERCMADDSPNACWVWGGAVSRGTGGAGCPVAWSPAHGRVISVPRMAVEFSGRKLSRSQMVWKTCRCDTCCNPKHLRVGTRAEWGQWVAKRDMWKGDLTRTAARRKLRESLGCSLSMELAQWARESTQTGRDAAWGLSTSPTSVSRARLRKTWAESLPLSSVFSFAGMSHHRVANDRRAEVAA